MTVLRLDPELSASSFSFSPLPMPSICTMSWVLTRLEDSCSLAPPLEPASESISCRRISWRERSNAPSQTESAPNHQHLIFDAKYHSSVFRGDCGGGDVEEGGVALGGHCLGQHGFPCARGTEHEDSSPGPPNALEVVRHPQRQHHRLLEQVLRLAESGDGLPGHAHLGVHDMGEIVGFIHPSIQGIPELQSRSYVDWDTPIFEMLTGDVLTLASCTGFCRIEYAPGCSRGSHFKFFPQFVNEAAYYEKDIALIMTVMESIPTLS